jgi:hypothetical protein
MNHKFSERLAFFLQLLLIALGVAFFCTIFFQTCIDSKPKMKEKRFVREYDDNDKTSRIMVVFDKETGKKYLVVSLLSGTSMVEMKP